VAVLKMGTDVLAWPVSHLVNMSLSAGVFLSAFKTAIIHPVYKGEGKARSNPTLYRPVAILCALSKVLKTVAKEDLMTYVAANNILPTSQHGFQEGEVIYHGARHSPRGLGLSQGEGEGGGHSRV
jgi:hypothetical protein